MRTPARHPARPTARPTPARPTVTRTAALAAGALMLSVLAGCGEDADAQAEAGPSASSTPADPASSPQTPASGSPTASADSGRAEPQVSRSASPGSRGQAPGPAHRRGSAAPAEAVTVGVYFVGDAPGGPRLFRELRQVDAADPLGAAATLTTSGEALDPDYRSLFPAGAVESVGFEGPGRRGLYSVRLSDPSWTERPASMTRRQARLAVQQLVRTLQGAGGAHARVAFFVGTQQVPVLGLERARGFAAAPPLDVLALANVTSPRQGMRVRGSFTARGLASSFEATVPWELRRRSTVVRSGFATAAGWMDRLYPWQAEVDLSGLAPGRYTFVAFTDDPTGEGASREGAGPTRDTKTVVVR